MIHRYKYILLFLISFFRIFSQDVLIKKDSSRVEIIIKENTTTEIKYKRFSNPDGPLYSEKKTEFLGIEYKNGNKEVFQNKSEEKKESKKMERSEIVAQQREEYKKTHTISDWVRVSLDIGPAFSLKYNVVPVFDREAVKDGDVERYMKNSNSNKLCVSPHIALNLKLGRNRRLWALLSLSYFNLKTEYDYYGIDGYYYPALDPAKYTTSSYSVKGTYHFIGLNAGMDIKIRGGLHFTPIVSLDCTAKSKLSKTGTDVLTTRTISSSMGNTYNYNYSYDTTVYNNTMSIDDINLAMTSIQGKFSYDFKAKERVYGIYLLFHFGLEVQMNYLSLGLCWYPFKKLRPKLY